MLLTFALWIFFADQSTRVLLQNGLIALRQGRLTEARAALEEASRLESTNAYVWSSLAEAYWRLKQPSKAAAAADKAEQYGGDNAAIDHALSLFYTEAGQFARAAKLEEKYAESGKADAGAAVRAAGLYLNAGDAGSALELAQRALAASPTAQGEDVAGRALAALGRNAEAGLHLEAAWESAKSDPQIAFDYGDFLLKKQDIAKAAEVASAAAEEHPEDAQVVLMLGVARYGQRRFEEAVVEFLKVIQIDPSIPQPYEFLGRMLDQVGPHLAQITSAYERWVAKDPTSAEAQLLLAKARLAANSRDATAEGLLRRAIALDAANWEAHYELGALLEGKHEYKAAAVELQRSVELNSREAMPHYHLARVYDRLGETEKAGAERQKHAELSGAGK